MTLRQHQTPARPAPVRPTSTPVACTDSRLALVATTSVLDVDRYLHVFADLIDGKPLPRDTTVVQPSLAWLFIEGASNVYNTINPRIRKVVTDRRLACIIIKNTVGPNSDTFLGLESSATAKSCTSTCCRIGVNKDVCFTETTNDSLFPSIYQFGFGIEAIDAVMAERLPWLNDAYKYITPRIYDEHTLWTRLGGALEITGYAPTAYSQNERRGVVSEVANHVSNFKGITITMRKSDEATVKSLIRRWCQKEANLCPGMRFTWRDDEWKVMSGYGQSNLGQGILRCTDLFRTLRRAATRMIRSGVQSSLCYLVYGPPGTGKTRTVFELANSLGYNLFATSIVHDDADPAASTDRASVAIQFASLLTQTAPFVLLIDDVTIQHGRFTDCTLSRPKLLRLFEGQGFPSKSIIVLVSNNTDSVDMEQMYDGAMCRRGRVRLLESKPLVDAEKRRIRKRLRPTAYRRVDLTGVTRVCDLFASMIDAEDGDSRA